MSSPNYRYDTGLGNVGSYQVSGKPFASASIDASSATKVVNFPAVTSWIYVVNNTTSKCKVGFSERGVDHATTKNYFTVHSGSNSGKLDLKVTQVWLRGSSDVDVLAGLTGIAPERVLAVSPSGSNWSGSLGVQ